MQRTPKQSSRSQYFRQWAERVGMAYAGEGLSPAVVLRFRRLVRAVFARCGRVFPWRETYDPYRILVSEFMLQQTQVERVIPKYTAFLEAFPDAAALAAAPLGEVLRLWQGLGYNRRAVALHRAGKEIVLRFDGMPPEATDDLLSLHGVGPSTAGAVRAFAYGLPSIFVETNIRRVFIYVFFNGYGKVRDREILPLAARTLDRRNPREWYYGLMDFGALLAAGQDNPNRRSFHYKRQAPFEGSDRQARGKILRSLLEGGPAGENSLSLRTGVEEKKVRRIVTVLVAEGFVRKRNGKYMAG